jgi:hypothetical protein
MSYVQERLTALGVTPMVTRRKAKQIDHATRKAIRADYLTACKCCGRWPTQRELADRYGFDQAVIWRAVNSPLIKTYGRRNVPSRRTFQRISALQVAAMLCEGVDEGRRLASGLWPPEKPLQPISARGGT